MQLNEFPWAMLDRARSRFLTPPLTSTERVILFHKGSMAMREDAKPAKARALHGRGKRRTGAGKLA